MRSNFGIVELYEKRPNQENKKLTCFDFVVVIVGNKGRKVTGGGHLRAVGQLRYVRARIAQLKGNRSVTMTQVS